MNAQNQQAELPHALYEAQYEKMIQIVEETAPGNIPEDTILALSKWAP